MEVPWPGKSFGTARERPHKRNHTKYPKSTKIHDTKRQKLQRNKNTDTEKYITKKYIIQKCKCKLRCWKGECHGREIFWEGERRSTWKKPRKKYLKPWCFDVCIIKKRIKHIFGRNYWHWKFLHTDPHYKYTLHMCVCLCYLGQERLMQCLWTHSILSPPTYIDKNTFFWR